MWQKIETYPLPEFEKEHWWKSTDRVLLVENETVTIGWYCFTSKGKGRWKLIQGYIGKPTYWAPIPEKPKDVAKN